MSGPNPSAANARDSMILFRSKKKNVYNQKKHHLGRYHLSYKQNMTRSKSSSTKTLCGLVCYIDWNTPFEVINLGDKMIKTTSFTEEVEKKYPINDEMRLLMCERCLYSIAYLLTSSQEEKASAAHLKSLRSNL